MIANRLTALAETPVGEKRLAAGITQYLGQMMMARDNREQSALAMARGMLYHGQVRSMAEIAERLRAVTQADILRCAGRIAHPDILTFL